MKTCSKCQTELPIEFFAKGAGVDGLHPWCRSCRTEYSRQYRKINPPTPLTPEQQRRAALKHHYDLTPEAYDLLLEKQNWKCAVCPATPEGSPRHFHVDHDHACCPGVRSCGKCIRGILCSNCNRALGFAGDSPERLRALAKYLEEF